VPAAISLLSARSVRPVATPSAVARRVEWLPHNWLAHHMLIDHVPTHLLARCCLRADGCSRVCCKLWFAHTTFFLSSQKQPWKTAEYAEMRRPMSSCVRKSLRRLLTQALTPLLRPHPVQLRPQDLFALPRPMAQADDHEKSVGHVVPVLPREA
jgi:hypothetical protein